MRIQEQLEKLDEYNSRTDDVDKNQDLLMEEKCVNCPLYKTI